MSFFSGYKTTHTAFFFLFHRWSATLFGEKNSAWLQPCTAQQVFHSALQCFPEKGTRTRCFTRIAFFHIDHAGEGLVNW